MNVKKILGKNVKYYRSKAGYTQDQLSEKLDIYPKHVSKIEVGKKFPSPELIEKISEVFNIPVSSLFFYEDNEKTGDDSYSKIDEFINDSTKKFVNKLKQKLREF